MPLAWKEVCAQSPWPALPGWKQQQGVHQGLPWGQPWAEGSQTRGQRTRQTLSGDPSSSSSSMKKWEKEKEKLGGR